MLLAGRGHTAGKTQLSRPAAIRSGDPLRIWQAEFPKAVHFANAGFCPQQAPLARTRKSH